MTHAHHGDERRALRHLKALVAGAIPARWLGPLTVLAWLVLAVGAVMVPEPFNVVPAAALGVLTFVAAGWHAIR